jgi:hypothetical protein
MPLRTYMFCISQLTYKKFCVPRQFFFFFFFVKCTYLFKYGSLVEDYTDYGLQKIRGQFDPLNDHPNMSQTMHTIHKS